MFILLSDAVPDQRMTRHESLSLRVVAAQDGTGKEVRFPLMFLPFKRVQSC